MKAKYYTTIAALAAFACAAQAGAATIYGSIDEANATEIKAAGENLDVELYPNDSDPAAEAFFKGNGNTVRSLTSENTSANLNISGKTVIDIAAADSGEYTALNNAGTMTLGTDGVIEIANSAGSAATAVLNLGDFTIGGGTYTNGFVFKTNARVSGTSLTVGKDSGTEESLRITNNSTVDYSVEKTTFANFTGIKIDKGSTLNASGKMEFNGAAATLNIDGTFNYAGTGITLYRTTINGEFKFTGREMKLMGSSTINGGVLDSSGFVVINATDLTISNGGKININSTAANRFRIALEERATLNLKTENALTDSKNGYADIIIRGKLASYSSNATLHVYADNMLGDLVFDRSENAVLTIIVEDGAHLYFNDVSYTYEQGKTTLNINKFVANSIFFRNITGWDDITNVFLTDINGNKYNKDQLAWIKGKYTDGTDGYWLAIPEPSTYAAIFGAVALALAAFRRRK